MRAVMLCTALLSAAMLFVSPASAQNQKEYISSTEADKVREAMDPNERIRLFLSFASDRLKQLQYELDHPANTVRRAEKLNGLLNSYAGCIDEATDRMELSVEKQEDVQEGIKAVQKQAPDFLTHLKDLAAKGPERNTYKENLDDAIASTEDAIRSAAEAMKDKAPAPPVRRPQ
jgi:peptidoglycan hydrolase CwlO-like protein